MTPVKTSTAVASEYVEDITRIKADVRSLYASRKMLLSALGVLLGHAAVLIVWGASLHTTTLEMKATLKDIESDRFTMKDGRAIRELEEARHDRISEELSWLRASVIADGTAIGILMDRSKHQK